MTVYSIVIEYTLDVHLLTRVTYPPTLRRSTCNNVCIQ